MSSLCIVLGRLWIWGWSKLDKWSIEWCFYTYVPLSVSINTQQLSCVLRRQCWYNPVFQCSVMNVFSNPSLVLPDSLFTCLFLWSMFVMTLSEIDYYPGRLDWIAREYWLGYPGPNWLPVTELWWNMAYEDDSYSFLQTKHAWYV